MHKSDGASEGIRAAAVHPGGIQTELGRSTDPGRIEKLVAQINEQLAAQGKGRGTPSERNSSHCSAHEANRLAELRGRLGPLERVLPWSIEVLVRMRKLNHF